MSVNDADVAGELIGGGGGGGGWDWGGEDLGRTEEGEVVEAKRFVFSRRPWRREKRLRRRFSKTVERLWCRDGVF